MRLLENQAEVKRGEEMRRKSRRKFWQYAKEKMRSGNSTEGELPEQIAENLKSKIQSVKTVETVKSVGVRRGAGLKPGVNEIDSAGEPRRDGLIGWD
jgi:hypothetical protein